MGFVWRTCEYKCLTYTKVLRKLNWKKEKNETVQMFTSVWRYFLNMYNIQFFYKLNENFKINSNWYLKKKKTWQMWQIERLGKRCHLRLIYMKCLNSCVKRWHASWRASSQGIILLARNSNNNNHNYRSKNI